MSIDVLEQLLMLQDNLLILNMDLRSKLANQLLYINRGFALAFPKCLFLLNCMHLIFDFATRCLAYLKWIKVF